MNKQMAGAKSIEGKITMGELRRMIANSRQLGGMSKVNSQCTMEMACDIYEKALEGRDDAEIPKGTKYDVYKRRDVPSMDSLIIRNILRDCA